jgi:RNA polymerase sigma-70 factor (ECF subfamily)
MRISETGTAVGVTTLRIEGRLTRDTMGELAASCTAALRAGQTLRLDLSGVRFADAAGVRAVREARAAGAVLLDCSGFLAELLKAETGTPAGHAEDELVARLRAGDDAAFESLVRQYGGRMLAVAKRFLKNESDARDAVQDAFLAAFRSIGSFAGGAQLSTWLHRIVVNAALMKLRTRRRKPEEPIDDLLPRFAEDGHHQDGVPGWAAAADVLVEREEVRLHVRRAIEQLPDSYRTVLLLRDIEQRGTDETAALLGMTPQAVKTRLHRARQALRTLIERELVCKDVAA